MRRIAFIAGVVIASGALVAGIYAAPLKTIAGTPKNDVLRGTPAADTLNGKGGNDKLYGRGGNDTLIGGAGNDLLVGGAGKDNLRCGPGHDTAIADAKDSVSSDCETVKGLPATTPTPPPEPTPPTPPAPPAPTGPTAKAGHYCGFTNQGKSICFDATTTTVSNFDTTSDIACGSLGTVPDLRLEFRGSAPIQSDLTFTFSFNGPVDAGDSGLTNVKMSYSVTGKFDTAGNATGILNFSQLSFDYQGLHVDCGAAPYAWQAKAGA
jgi:RTX calcium-binding nonapeptide repeat (4 copies)